MRLFLLTLVLFITANAFPQLVNLSLEDRSRYLNHNTKWSLKEETGYQDGDNVIQVEASGIKRQLAYTARYARQMHAIIIHKLDKTGKEIAVNKVEGGERSFGPVRTTSIAFDDKIVLFHFKYTDKDTMKFYMSEVDKQNLQLVNTVQLFSYPQKNVGLFGLANEASREIVLETSPDNSKLLIMAPGRKEEYFSCVVEKGLKVTRKKVSVTSGSDGFVVSAAYVDNAGNSIAAISYPIFSFHLFGYSNGKFILMQKADNSEKVINVESLGLQAELHNITFKGSRDNSQVFIAGGYQGVIGMAGIAFTSVQLDKFKIDRVKSLAYPTEYARRIYDIGFGSRKRKEFGIEDSQFELVDFGNGELAICGTLTKKVEGTKYTSFYAGPVIVAFLNKKKEPVFTMIPRRQHFCGGSYPVYLPYQDKLVVIYNDYAKNITSPILPNDVHQKAGSIVSKLALACAVITKDGTVESRKMLSEGISRENFFNTSESEITDNSKVSIPTASIDKKSEEQKVAVITVQ